MPKKDPITNFELKGWVHPVTGDVLVDDVDGTFVFEVKDAQGSTYYLADRGNGYLAVREFPDGVGRNWIGRRKKEFADDLKKLAAATKPKRVAKKKVAKKKVAKKRAAKKASA